MMETTVTFEEAVAKGSLVLVDFWAEWCGPCRMMNPIIEKLKKDYEGKMDVVKVNADNNPALTEQYGVQSLPSFIFIKGGKEVQRMVGATSETRLKEAADSLL